MGKGSRTPVMQAVWLIAFTILWVGSANALELDGIVTDGKDPISGARVRVQGQNDFVVTDRNGRFHLSTPVEFPEDTFVVTAGKEGWFSNGVKITHTTTFTTLELERVPDDDNPNYDFINPHESLVNLSEDETRLEALRSKAHNNLKESCLVCHYEPTCWLCHHDTYLQWEPSFHAKATTDPWVQDLYTGMDSEGNENVGPGYRLDFPDNPGDCADCHAPSAAVRAPGKTDLRVVYNRNKAYPLQRGRKTQDQVELERKAGSVGAQGVHCDFCHKIREVTVNDRPGVDGAIKVHRPAFEKEEEEAKSQGLLSPILVYGAFDDVVTFASLWQMPITSPMKASYNPLFASSDLCSGCHQYKNKYGIATINTYREWEESQFAYEGITCQGCHMLPDLDLGFGAIASGDAEKYWGPVGGRDINTVLRHDFVGAEPGFLMENAATLAIEVIMKADEMTVKVDAINDVTGHHIPTGITIRNMLLLVTPLLANGDTLEYIGEERIPEYGGVGPLEEGNYAGLPGRGFAQIFGDDEGNTHVLDWQATRIVSDTRIKAKARDTSYYTFALPQDPEKISIETRLIYRRAFKPLADLKKWELEDIYVAADTTVVESRGRLKATASLKEVSVLDRVMEWFGSLF